MSLLVQYCAETKSYYTHTQTCVCCTTYMFTLQLTKIVVTTNTAQRSKMESNVCCVYIHVIYCTLHTSNTLSITLTLTPTYCSSTRKEQSSRLGGREKEKELGRTKNSENTVVHKSEIATDVSAVRLLVLCRDE